jgi:hypothetical protein
LVFLVVIDYFPIERYFQNISRDAIWGIFTICEFAFFSVFFYLILGNSKLKKIVAFLSPSILVVILWSFIKSDKQAFDSISASIESISLIVFSIVFLFEQVNKPYPTDLLGTANFWLVMGILVYAASVLFLFVVGIVAPSEAKQYWFINSISSILTNLIFCVAFTRTENITPHTPIENATLN